MPLFEYLAVSPRGKKVKATIDAESLQDAKVKLIRRKIAAIKIRSLGEKDLKDTLKKSEILNLTRELSRLIHAGLPLFEALSALEEKYLGQKPHKILLNLVDMVRSGHKFSEALGKHHTSFDLLYITIVENAEKTGKLSEALDELTDLMNKQIQIKKQVTAALLYPGILFSFCLLVLGSLLFYVIPSLKEIFDGRDLHPFTKIIFTVSAFACNSKTYACFILTTLILISVGLFSTQRGKKRFYLLPFQIPFIKKLLQKVAIIRFSRAIATLLEGGVPIIQSLDQARKIIRHPDLEKIIQKAQRLISEGQPIHIPFQNESLIPPLIPRMISIAEEGGKLPFMMKQIAQIYEEELEKTLTYFTTVAQPILLLILGLIIGFVLLSVLLPMTDVSSFTT